MTIQPQQYGLVNLGDRGDLRCEGWICRFRSRKAAAEAIKILLFLLLLLSYIFLIFRRNFLIYY